LNFILFFPQNRLKSFIEVKLFQVLAQHFKHFKFVLENFFRHEMFDTRWHPNVMLDTMLKLQSGSDDSLFVVDTELMLANE
jgi:hypothetical protein